MPSFVVLGARNLGGAIVDRLVADGWQGAAVARSDDTLEAVRARGALALQADVTDPVALAGALSTARDELGRIDLLVNAVSVIQYDPETPMGGGALADATLARYEAWGAAFARQAFVVWSQAARSLEAPAAAIQVANDFTSNVAPGWGLWAAGWHGVRALTLAAAAELDERGINVTLLVVDGMIRSPKTEARVPHVPPERIHRQEDVAAEVARIAGAPGAREIVLSPTVA